MNVSKAVLLDLHDAPHNCMGVVLDHAATVPFDMGAQRLDGFGRPTVREQITHVFSAETAWVSALQMRPELRRFDAAALQPAHDFRRAQGEATEGTRSHLNSITEQALNSNLERYHPEWKSPHRTPAFILVHVITHGFHHKGRS